MDQSTTTREWLGWLTRVRLLTILLILGVGLIWPQYLPVSSSNHSFLPLLFAWVLLGALHVALVRWARGYVWQGAFQVAGDSFLFEALLRRVRLGGNGAHGSFLHRIHGFDHGLSTVS